MATAQVVAVSPTESISLQRLSSTVGARRSAGEHEVYTSEKCNGLVGGAHHVAASQRRFPLLSLPSQQPLVLLLFVLMLLKTQLLLLLCFFGRNAAIRPCRVPCRHLGSHIRMVLRGATWGLFKTAFFLIHVAGIAQALRGACTSLGGSGFSN